MITLNKILQKIQKKFYVRFYQIKYVQFSTILALLTKKVDMELLIF